MDPLAGGPHTAAWPAVTGTCAQPLKSKTWLAAMQVVTGRCGGQSPYRSFRGLLAHLATLTRNQVRFAGATAT